LIARHVLRQGRVVAAFAGTGARALFARPRADAAPPSTPGPELIAQVAPPAPALVRDYLRHVGGDPSAYTDVVPPHLFPQWCFPLAARAMRGLPYSLPKLLNAGCRLEINAPLLARAPFALRARLEGIADDGRRVVLHQRLVTGTAADPDALVVHFYTVVPSLARPSPAADAGGRPRAREAALVPDGARELERWEVGRAAGLAFAALTGDFNPVHWLRPYARVMGLPGTILQGFATLARAVEGLQRACFAGAVDRLRVVDVRFVRPLPLPARVGLFLDGTRLFVGDARSTRPYLAGSFELR
jgi:acyl dehydratase